MISYLAPLTKAILIGCRSIYLVPPNNLSPLIELLSAGCRTRSRRGSPPRQSVKWLSDNGKCHPQCGPEDGQPNTKGYRMTVDEKSEFENKIRAEIQKYQQRTHPIFVGVIVLNYFRAQAMGLRQLINGRYYFEGYEVELSLRMGDDDILTPYDAHDGGAFRQIQFLEGAADHL